jgi:hypothetical protein
MEEYRIDPTISYDVVELPSRGIHYPNNKKSVKVSYLTAADENILSSQNLIATNGVMEELLKRKVLDKDIDTNDLAEEDKQAILLFLRNTAFGPEYKFYLTDPKTEKEFTTSVDLSEVKFKDFTLAPDANGEFNYHMSKCNVDVTFKFLTPKQKEDIKKIRTFLIECIQLDSERVYDSDIKKLMNWFHALKSVLDFNTLGKKDEETAEVEKSEEVKEIVAEEVIEEKPKKTPAKKTAAKKTAAKKVKDSE